MGNTNFPRICMIRSTLKMAEASAKRIKTSPVTIGTHNGHFHADEALAVYMLRLLPTYSSSQLVRTRDPALLQTCHTVVDVGGEYDASTNRYDHHQRTFNTTFPRLSQLLVWRRDSVMEDFLWVLWSQD